MRDFRNLNVPLLIQITGSHSHIKFQWYLWQDPNSLFRIYSEEGCLFECRLRNASSHTNCIPWDYPVPQDLDGIDICLGWQNGTNNMKKFNAIMDDPEVINTCNCLPDCEHITYETQVGTWVTINTKPAVQCLGPGVRVSRRFAECIFMGSKCQTEQDNFSSAMVC